MTVHYERSIFRRLLLFVFSVPILLAGCIAWTVIWACEKVLGGER